MTEPAEVPLHPVAVEILERVVPVEDGAASVIPSSAFAGLQRRLTARREETELFIHLCVLQARLRDRGLTAAAGQLLALASIGLDKSEVERTLDEVDRLRRAAQSLASPGAAKPGPPLKAGVNLGFGLRGGAGTKLPAPPKSKKKEPKP